MYTPHPTIIRLLRLNWLLIGLIMAISIFGFVVQYSAAEGNFDPWASKQIIRFCLFFPIMLAIAVMPIRFWLTHAYTIYFVVLFLLAAVEAIGFTAMGATRWLDIGIISLQPSEMMKVAVILALARYFHSITLEETGNPFYLIPPLLLIFIPAGLVLIQPDLGTATIIIIIGGLMFFAAGVRWWKFGLLAAAAAAAIPVLWHYMHDYQRNRIFSFLDPERDPLGTGYNIIQSKIAIGSGGISGKGFLQGTQSQLSFLPEKQTDFIFTMLSEEFGFIGSITVILLYGYLLFQGYLIAYSARSHFGRMLAMGVLCLTFTHVFINIAMVMGLIPVVGVPLPLLSYGGTTMVTIMGSFGLLLCVQTWRDELLERNVRGLG